MRTSLIKIQKPAISKNRTTRTHSPQRQHQPNNAETHPSTYHPHNNSTLTAKNRPRVEDPTHPGGDTPL